MRIQDIERLVDMVAEANVSEVTVFSEQTRVTIRKNRNASPPVSEQDSLVVYEEQLPQMDENEFVFSPQSTYITSTMVGIFHNTKQPLQVGTKVDTGQVIGQIESMKLMSDVRSELQGEVLEILIDEGMPVEFGQPLFSLQRME